MFKKILVGIALVFSVVLNPQWAEAAPKIYYATCLTGGGLCLDGKDGTSLSNKDGAIVITEGFDVYHYTLDADSGQAESSPDVITPDTSAGTKRWILTSIDEVDIRAAGNTKFFNFETSSVGTGYVLGEMINDGGTLRLGVEDSSGGALATGTSAYGSVIGSETNTPLHLITNDVTRATVDTSGNMGFVNYVSTSGNENIKWDVVEFTVDGTTPDSTSYTVDESKVASLTCTGHDGSTRAMAVNTDSGSSNYLFCYIFENTLSVEYGATYGSGDKIHVFITTIE